MEVDLTYISLGAGRQSTAMAICSAKGLHGVPKADLAIFADTQDENQETYDHLNTLEEFLKEHGIPLHRVTVGKLSSVIFGKSCTEERVCSQHTRMDQGRFDKEAMYGTLQT